MDVSIVVLTFNEEKNIGDCLKSILRQRYPNGDWEVIVVDGNSTDNTTRIVMDMQRTTNRLRLVSNENQKISQGRNVGVSRSLYPFIAFTDADCVVPEDWLKKLAEGFQKIEKMDSKVAGVGSANIPPKDKGRFYEALGIYLDSYLGCFNSPQGRDYPYDKKVTSLSCTNALYRKQTLLDIGGFDISLGNISEDRDINIRLIKKGHSLYFIPKNAVVHKLRNNLFSWLKNMALYGRGRAIISFKHRLFIEPFFILPLFFILTFFLVPLCFLWPFFIFPLLYFPFIAVYVLIITTKRRKISLFLGVVKIFIFTHFVYAFNLFYESLKIIFRKIFLYLSPKQYESTTN